jgi:diacylglycerol kinase
MRKKNRFRVAFNGLWFVFKNEGHFKFHVVMFILVVLFGIYFRIENWEWAAVFLCSLMVFICEIINTAIEQLCD